MPEITIPLVGPHNQRQQLVLGQTTDFQKDQRFINCFTSLVQNNITKSADVYLERRPGLFSLGSVNAGNNNYNVYSSKGDPNGSRLIVIQGTNVYYVTTDLATKTLVGATDSNVENISEGYIGATLYYFLQAGSGSGSGTGWLLTSDAANDSTPTFTADVANGSPILTNVSSTTNLHVGQKLSGTGISAGQRILTIDSATQVTMTSNASATNSGVTVTFERLAKIIDADFPANPIGQFVTIDGYLFIAEATNRRIYGSALNNPSSWGASNYIAFGVTSDIPKSLFSYKNMVGCLGRRSIEFYYNAGNPSGSVLSRSDQLTSRVGADGASGRSVSFVGDNVFFIGGESGQNRGIFTLIGYTPKKISSAALDKNMTGGTAFDLSAFNMNGFNWVLAGQNTSPRKKFLICADIGVESEVQLGSGDNTGVIVIAGGSSPISATQGNQGVWAINTSTDDLYRLRNDIYQDDSVAFPVIVQTKKADLGTGNRKTYKTVWLMGSDVQSSGTATLEYSDDDYATWVTVGTFDLTQPQPKIDRAGSHRGGRAWRLTHSANTAFRAQALKFDYTVGAH